ncbi:LOW QUALITY PROTEIN: mas-related G-protein coupled receptor member X2-like [Sarcophilus harrisii]
MNNDFTIEVKSLSVLWLLGFCIRRNPISVYILNLAGADALYLCCSFLNPIFGFWGYNSDNLICKIVILQIQSYTAGLNLLAMISTERCLSTLFPVWYRCHRPKHTSASVCAGLWVLASLLELMPFLFEEYVSSSCYNFVIIEGVYFFLLSILCVSSLTLLLRVQCSSQHQQPPRLYLLVLLPVLVFLLFGLPIRISEFMSFQLNIKSIPPWPFEGLACVNSSVNPFIYFFMGRQRHNPREPLRVVLQRALGDEQELGHRTSTPHTSSQETSF